MRSCVLLTTVILGSVCLSFSSDTVTPKTPATKKRIPMVKRQRSVVSASLSALSDREENRLDSRFPSVVTQNHEATPAEPLCGRHARSRRSALASSSPAPPSPPRPPD